MVHGQLKMSPWAKVKVFEILNIKRQVRITVLVLQHIIIIA